MQKRWKIWLMLEVLEVLEVLGSFAASYEKFFFGRFEDTCFTGSVSGSFQQMLQEQFKQKLQHSQYISADSSSRPKTSEPRGIRQSGGWVPNEALGCRVGPHECQGECSMPRSHSKHRRTQQNIVRCFTRSEQGFGKGFQQFENQTKVCNFTIQERYENLVWVCRNTL